ncbi:hypothetical protein NPIL_119601 [Nephila pilipes]|uniref:Uncharacterized protein n=1 Tax=Nephila pilipes TaxID=299642 RepID=A0A8X6TR82_NEPPI|nr:hypothetical protein NPIL_119601 [Nephila pilipes]
MSNSKSNIINYFMSKEVIKQPPTFCDLRCMEARTLSKISDVSEILIADTAMLATRFSTPLTGMSYASDLIWSQKKYSNHDRSGDQGGQHTGTR